MLQDFADQYDSIKNQKEKSVKLPGCYLNSFLVQYCCGSVTINNYKKVEGLLSKCVRQKGKTIFSNDIYSPLLQKCQLLYEWQFVR